MSAGSKVSQLDAAATQLERALSLYLNDGDYLSAITLAGAAENIFGQALAATGVAKSLTGHAKVHAWFTKSISGATLTPQEATTELNDARDWLKHYKAGSHMTFDAKLRAHEMIERAIYNFVAVTGSESDLMRRFSAESMK